MKKILGLIPARGGSKGVPNKNIRLLNNKPLIAHTIETATKSELLTDVVVSTDDHKISDVSKCFGANVPFLRPEHIATDEAKTIDVCLHAINYFQKNGMNFEILVLLQPTSPLRSVHDIDGTINLLLNHKKNSCITLSSVGSCHPNYIYRRKSLEVDIFSPLITHQVIGERRQEFEDYYYRNGAVYAVRTDFLLKNNLIMDKESLGFIMPEIRSVNIDTEFDFIMAEKLIEMNEKNIKR